MTLEKLQDALKWINRHALMAASESIANYIYSSEDPVKISSLAYEIGGELASDDLYYAIGRMEHAGLVKIEGDLITWVGPKPANSAAQ